MEEEQKEEEIIHIKDQCGRLWVKNVKIRNSGESHGQLDVYIINPDGEKLRSVKELTSFILRTGYFEIDPEEVNFEKPDSMLGHQPTFPRTLHRNTKEFIQFIATKGSHVPNYMSRRSNRPRTTPNRPRTTPKSQNNNPPLKLEISTKDLKQCDICSYYADTFIIKKKKVLCDMCTLKSNQEKLLWYLSYYQAPPCLAMEFERIGRSTAMTLDEIRDFYSDEILRRAQEETPGRYDNFEDDFDEDDNVSVASSVPSLEEKTDAIEKDKARNDNNNAPTNETEDQLDYQDNDATTLNGNKRSINSAGSSTEKKIKTEPKSPQKSPEVEPRKEIEPQPSVPKELPMVTIPEKSNYDDLVQLMKKEITKEDSESEEEVDEDDIPDLDAH